MKVLKTLGIILIALTILAFAFNQYWQGKYYNQKYRNEVPKGFLLPSFPELP